MTHYDISDEDGRFLVSTARKIVTEFLRAGHKPKIDKDVESKLSFDAGVFVTLNLNDDLRGCIGFPLPKNLSQALPEAAIAAATEDTRFSPVESHELDNITFEVTILTPPSEITSDDPQELLSKIKVGRDGLIIKHGYHSGLLLPQVPVEYGWSEKKFLERTCQKAGLPSNCWKGKDVQIFSFEGIIFKEEKPNGVVVREKL